MAAKNSQYTYIKKGECPPPLTRAQQIEYQKTDHELIAKVNESLKLCAEIGGTTFSQTLKFVTQAHKERLQEVLKQAGTTLTVEELAISRAQSLSSCITKSAYRQIMRSRGAASHEIAPRAWFARRERNRCIQAEQNQRTRIYIQGEKTPPKILQDVVSPKTRRERAEIVARIVGEQAQQQRLGRVQINLVMVGRQGEIEELQGQFLWLLETTKAIGYRRVISPQKNGVPHITAQIDVEPADLKTVLEECQRLCDWAEKDDATKPKAWARYMAKNYAYTGGEDEADWAALWNVRRFACGGTTPKGALSVWRSAKKLLLVLINDLNSQLRYCFANAYEIYSAKNLLSAIMAGRYDQFLRAIGTVGYKVVKAMIDGMPMREVWLVVGQSATEALENMSKNVYFFTSNPDLSPNITDDFDTAKKHWDDWDEIGCTEFFKRIARRKYRIPRFILSRLGIVVSISTSTPALAARQPGGALKTHHQVTRSFGAIAAVNRPLDAPAGRQSAV